MRFEISGLRRADAEEICAWHYETPYSFYDMQADPDDLKEFLSPPDGVHQFAVRDRTGSLAGFLTFIEDEGGWLETGLGLRLDLTGRGLGEGFLLLGLEFAAERFGPQGMRLKVASFNKRAIKVY